MQSNEFKRLISIKGRQLYRQMPWRDDTRPYSVLVSEMMLQQTQVARVTPKFKAFMSKFPDEKTLAAASLADVLMQWQGLGYNRRAKFLHESAKIICTDFNGSFPQDEADIIKLPGVGKNTLGALLAYSFNRPSIFIETNIRTVYLHHFYQNDYDVDDMQIKENLIATLDTKHPREFYWALMDYGSWLKANGVRNNSLSKHYKKQPTLEGSVRQVRGKIIRVIGNKSLKLRQLEKLVAADEHFPVALSGLLKEGLVTETASLYYLTK